MKYIIMLIILVMLSGCATQKAHYFRIVPDVSGSRTTISHDKAMLDCQSAYYKAIVRR